MKKIGLLFFLLPVIAIAEGREVEFDLQRSFLKWQAAKVTGEHFGNLKLHQGKGKYFDDGRVEGEFVIDMESLTVTDIEDPKYNKKLVDHLKSDDFFSVGTHPEVTFVITESKPLEKGKIELTGDLTIKGINQRVTFPAEIHISDDNQLHAMGKAKLDRTKWNVRYGSGKFFQNLGDKLIYDDFTVDIHLYGKVAE